MAKNTKKDSFTPDQLKVLSRVFHAVWDEIAYDILQAVQEMDGKDWIPRAEVVEMVLDADRPTDFCKTPEEKELYKKLRELPFAELNKIVTEMFPYARYGM